MEELSKENRPGRTGARTFADRRGCLTAWLAENCGMKFQILPPFLNLPSPIPEGRGTLRWRHEASVKKSWKLCPLSAVVAKVGGREAEAPQNS